MDAAAAREAPVAPYGDEARSPSRHLTGYAAIADHLRELSEVVSVSVQRENDWVVLRGLMVVGRSDEASEVVGRLVIRLEDDDIDDDWADVPIFVSYLDQGEWFTMRSVVRSRSDAGLAIDAPSELANRAPPTPGGGLRAIEPESAPSGERVYVVLETEEVADRATDAVYATLKGADLRGRTRRGQMTNHPGQLAVIISRLEAEAGLLLSVGDDHSVYAVSMARSLIGQARPALVITFDGKRRPEVERGHVLHLTGMVAGRLCTMRLVVEEIDASGLVCPEPDSVVRYQRRSNPRFRILDKQLNMTIVDEDGERWPVKKVSDLSAGGIGVIPVEAPAMVVNDRATFAISMRADHEVSFPVRVASVDSTFSPVRMGMQFLDLSANQMRMLDRVIHKLGRAVVDQ